MNLKGKQRMASVILLYFRQSFIVSLNARYLRLQLPFFLTPCNLVLRFRYSKR